MLKLQIRKNKNIPFAIQLLFDIHIIKIYTDVIIFKIFNLK